MSDELLRRFLDKLQRREAPGRRPAPHAPTMEDEATDPATLRVRGVEHGLFPSAASLNRDFAARSPRLRLTIDLGEEFRRRAARPDDRAREALLRLCPTLPEHACADRQGLESWLSGEAPSPASRARSEPEADGLPVAHLVEHVALDLLSAATPTGRRSGAACAYRERPERYDVFFECDDPVLGRAAALLSAAGARDICLAPDRVDLHARCRSLVADLAQRGKSQVVAEDVAAARGWRVPEALQALEALGRLGFLESIPAPFTFSSTTGLIFRRVAPDGPADR